MDAPDEIATPVVLLASTLPQIVRNVQLDVIFWVKTAWQCVRWDFMQAVQRNHAKLVLLTASVAS